MELDDCSYGELHSVSVTHSVKGAASTADFLLILDPLDNNSHPDRFQLLKAASLLYKDIAQSIKGALKPDAKVGICVALSKCSSEIILILLNFYFHLVNLLESTFPDHMYQIRALIPLQIVINGYKACLGGMLLKHHGVASDNISVVVTLDEQRMRAKLAKRLSVIIV